MSSNSKTQEQGQKPAFPWGVCVGIIGGSSTTGAKPNLLFPTRTGGLLVTADQSNQESQARLIETAALSIVDAMPHRGVEVHVIDHSIRKRFPRLAELASLRQYRIHDNRESARKALDDCEALARYRHHELLDADTPTLDAYHQTSRGLERYRILLVNLDDFPRAKEEKDQLLTLCDAAFEAGIYVLAYCNSDLAHDDQEKPGIPVVELLAKRYPSISLVNDKLEIPPHIDLSPLLEHLQRHQWHPQAPSIDLMSILGRRKQIAEQASDGQRDFLVVPVGTTPDGRRDIEFRLGALSDCNNAFLVGMSGSGKTTLLNHLILGIAERYNSDELRLYLMDYKDGVEFQVFAGHPNVERIFLDNRDLDAAHQLLESFVATIDERGAMFRAAGVKDIDGWNTRLTPENGEIQRLPRLMLIIDEAQRLLTDNAAGRKFNGLLKDVVKRGRSFGVHMLLATQTLVNLSIERDLMTQIALRIAFKLNSDDDCARIFNYNNLAPQRLDRYEFIYNPDSGYRDANQRGKSLPYLEPSEISARITAIRAKRPGAQKLTPEVVSTVGGAIAPTAPRTPSTEGFELPGAAEQIKAPTWASAKPSANKMRNQQHEALLAMLLQQQADASSRTTPLNETPLSGA